jgi:hypothetical protein
MKHDSEQSRLSVKLVSSKPTDIELRRLRYGWISLPSGSSTLNNAPEFVAPGVLFPPQLAGSIGDYDGRKSCIVAL